MVEQLRAELAKRGAVIAAQAKLLEALTAKVQGLEALVSRQDALLGQNSRNLSLPSSSDGPSGASGAHPRPKPKSGRKRGGQKKHKGLHRALVSAENVDEVVDMYPAHCAACAACLPKTPDTRPKRPLEFLRAQAEARRERDHRLTRGRLDRAEEALRERLQLLGRAAGRWRGASLRRCCRPRSLPARRRAPHRREPAPQRLAELRLVRCDLLPDRRRRDGAEP